MFSYEGIFKNDHYKNNEPNRSHANGSHGSNRPMMRGFSKGSYRNRKPTFLEQIYTVEVVVNVSSVSLEASVMSVLKINLVPIYAEKYYYVSLRPIKLKIGIMDSELLKMYFAKLSDIRQTNSYKGQRQLSS